MSDEERFIEGEPSADDLLYDEPTDEDSPRKPELQKPDRAKETEKSLRQHREAHELDHLRGSVKKKHFETDIRSIFDIVHVEAENALVIDAGVTAKQGLMVVRGLPGELGIADQIKGPPGLPLDIEAAENEDVNVTGKNINFIANGGDGNINFNGQMAGITLQTKFVRVDDKILYSASGKPGTPMTELALEIIPKFSNSLLHVQWFLHGESTNHNTGFRLQINGSQPNDAYNTVSGDQQWSVLASDLYDGNDDSTPRITTINYFYEPGNTDLQSIVPTVSSTNTNSYTYKLNRTKGSTGTNSHETGVSWGIVKEIAQ